MPDERRYDVKPAAEGCLFALIAMAGATFVILAAITSAFSVDSDKAWDVVVLVLWPFGVAYAGYRACRNRTTGSTNAVVVAVLAGFVLISSLARDHVSLTGMLYSPGVYWRAIVMLVVVFPAALAGARIAQRPAS